MPRPMGKPGAKGSEKSKNFFGSIKRLIENLKPWKILLVFSIVLALCSAILALISPDKLSSLTDTITDGIMPKTEKLSTVMESTISNLQENLKTKILEVMASNDVSEEDKQNFMMISPVRFEWLMGYDDFKTNGEFRKTRRIPCGFCSNSRFCF